MCVWCVCVIFISPLRIEFTSLWVRQLTSSRRPRLTSNWHAGGSHDCPRADMLAVTATTALALTHSSRPSRLPSRWWRARGGHDYPQLTYSLDGHDCPYSDTLTEATTTLTVTPSRRPRLSSRWHARGGHGCPHTDWHAGGGHDSHHANTLATATTDTLAVVTTTLTLARWWRSRLLSRWHARDGHDDPYAEMLADVTTVIELTCSRRPQLHYLRWHVHSDHDYPRADILTTATTVLNGHARGGQDCPCTDMLAVTTTALALTCSRQPRLPLHWHACGGHDCPCTDVLATTTNVLALTCSRRPRLPLHWRACGGHDCPCTGYEHHSLSCTHYVSECVCECLRAA